MARTDATAVGNIIEVDAAISVAPFIEAASAMVDYACTDDVVDGNAPDGDYDATQLELIERWLAAHFYAVRDPRTTMEKAGPVSESFQSKVDLGLNVTHYGQQAMRLDWNGGLARLDQQARTGGKRRATVAWTGKVYDGIDDGEA